jgi:hypothetical protein
MKAIDYRLHSDLETVKEIRTNIGRIREVHLKMPLMEG